MRAAQAKKDDDSFSDSSLSDPPSDLDYDKYLLKRRDHPLKRRRNTSKKTPTLQIETSTPQIETSTPQIETPTLQIETSTPQIEISTPQDETPEDQNPSKPDKPSPKKTPTPRTRTPKKTSTPQDEIPEDQNPSKPDKPPPKRRVTEEEIIEFLNRASKKIKLNIYQKLKTDEDVIDILESESPKKSKKSSKNSNSKSKKDGALSAEKVEIIIPRSKEERAKLAREMDLKELDEEKIGTLLQYHSQNGTIAAENLAQAVGFLQEKVTTITPGILLTSIMKYLKSHDETLVNEVDQKVSTRGLKAVKLITGGEKMVTGGMMRILYGWLELHIYVENRAIELKMATPVKKVGNQDSIFKSKVYHELIEEEIGSVAKAALTDEELNDRIGKLQTSKANGSRIAIFTNNFGLGFIFALSFANIIKGGYDISRWNYGFAPSFVQLIKTRDFFKDVMRICEVSGEFLEDLLDNNISVSSCIERMQELAKDLPSLTTAQVSYAIEVESDEEEDVQDGSFELIKLYPANYNIWITEGSYRVKINKSTLNCFCAKVWYDDSVILGILISYGGKILDASVRIIDSGICVSGTALKNKIGNEVTLLLFPLIVNQNHWVAGIASRNKDGKWEVKIMDSMQDEAYQKAAAKQVSRFLLLNTVTTGKPSCFIAPCAKQSGTSDCGPLTIANILSHFDQNEFVKEHNDKVGRALRLKQLRQILPKCPPDAVLGLESGELLEDDDGDVEMLGDIDSKVS